MINDAVLNINDKNLVIGETGTDSEVSFSSNSFLKGSPASEITLKGNINFNDIRFDQSSDGVTNALSNIYLEKDNNSEVSLVNKVNLKEGITLKSGTLNSNGNLVFLSDNAQTAVARGAGDGNLDGTINGDVVVQRYFPLTGLQRSFRYISLQLHHLHRFKLIGRKGRVLLQLQILIQILTLIPIRDLAHISQERKVLLAL